MTFWLVLGLMTAAALGAVVWPFIRRPSAVTGGSDLAVYRDQLEEIDRDRNEGSIGVAEAEAARVEVSRRLLAAADAVAAGKDAVAGFSARRWLAAALVLALPLGAVSFYLRYGSPDLPSQPLAERVARAHAAGGVTTAGNDPEAAQLAGLVAKVEAHLAANPEDGRGWEVLAPVYMRLDRFDDAVRAHRNAIRILGPSPDRLADLGESLVAAADGQVTPEARAEFERARATDADNVTAAFYLGLAAKQAGLRDDAARIWQDMITRAPAGATWVAFFQRALAGLDGKTEEATATAPAPAPVALEVPQELPPEQREAARPMVERLAERLKQDGSDPDAWVRLIRSYVVMAERGTAREALADARRALAGQPDKLKRLNDGVGPLGLEGGVLAALQGAAPAAPAASAPLPPAHPPVAMPGAAGAMAAPAAPGAPPALAPEQNDMVRGMVDRLASRLKENGSDVEGWLRLLRSYMVLGDRDKARAAAGDARRAVSGDPDKLKRIEDGVKELGIEG